MSYIDEFGMVEEGNVTGAEPVVATAADAASYAYWNSTEYLYRSEGGDAYAWSQDLIPSRTGVWLLGLRGR